MTYDLIWTAAADWKVKLLVLAFAGQMFLTILVYSSMAKARMSAGKAGKITADDYKIVGNEPEELAVYTRALANQFELPVLFYAVVLGGLALNCSSWLTVILAFAFVLARYLHVNEMTTTNKVMKRRKYFFRSVQIFMLMLAEFVFSALIYA